MNRTVRWTYLVLSRRYSSQLSPNIKQAGHIVDFLKKSDWKSVVGLEVHIQIASLSKLFSGAKFEFSSPVNSCVSLFDAAIPGTLPSLNQKCVEAAILTSLALECNINLESRFHRKHYFYSDLPAGYQITQYDQPIAEYGQLKFNVFTPGIHKTPYEKVCKLRQVQLEQDSGKTIHDDFENRSLVDLNRAGVALMELVFDPDLSDGEEAAALVKELILILQCLGTSTCKMQEGVLRVDANVSVQRRTDTKLGTRSEVKNIGSIRGVANAVNFEIVRQVALLEQGGVVVNETRAYDAATKRTVSMRDKENIQDYRFMPDPNLLPLRVSESLISSLQSSLPVLPVQLRDQLRDKYQLNPDFTNILSRDNQLLSLFYKIMHDNPSRSPRAVATVLVIHLLAIVNQHDLDLDETDPNEITQIVQRYIKDNAELVRTYRKKSEKKRVKIFANMLRTLAEGSGNTLNMARTKEVLEELLGKNESDGEK
ncbi:hypothetical protein M8J76_011066 [Diaphorina citri]|nr:hypothetical protein M8J76_011066 [Diaphorina citri]